MRNQEKIGAESFATICSVVAFDDREDGQGSTTLRLPLFLHANAKRVEQWLADYELEDTQDFVYVATAYLSMYEDGQLPKSLLR